jgi:hypothetical protein
MSFSGSIFIIMQFLSRRQSSMQRLRRPFTYSCRTRAPGPPHVIQLQKQYRQSCASSFSACVRRSTGLFTSQGFSWGGWGGADADAAGAAVAPPPLPGLSAVLLLLGEPLSEAIATKTRRGRGPEGEGGQLG